MQSNIQLPKNSIIWLDLKILLVEDSKGEINKLTEKTHCPSSSLMINYESPNGEGGGTVVVVVLVMVVWC